MAKRVPYQDKYIAALLARGEIKVESTSFKYTKITRKEGGFYYVGRAGALRIGCNIASSHPAPQSFKTQLLHKVT